MVWTDKYWKSRGLAVVLALSLMACNGGGGGDGGGDPPPPPPVTLTLSLVAGQAGGEGYADAQGSSARFNGPDGVAVDAAGNTYVSDRFNAVIRKISPTGVVTTLAGKAGETGHADGPAASARFNGLVGLAVAPNGDVIVADAMNHVIRRVTPDGVVSTVAGTPGDDGLQNGQGSAARFTRPTGVVVDAAGWMFVADQGNQALRKISPAGLVSTLVANPASCNPATGTPAVTCFSQPHALALDPAGQLLVADGSKVLKVSPAGSVSVVAGAVGGGHADGPVDSARFTILRGIAVDGAGNIYLSDSRERIPSMDFEQKFIGSSVVRKISPAGAVTTLAGSAGNPGSQDGPGAEARFNGPRGLALDGAGNLLVADSLNHTIRRVDAGGQVTTLAGLAYRAGYQDADGSGAMFDDLAAVVADAAGNLYVADRANHAIRKITAAGGVSTPAGKAGEPGNTDGPGHLARFREPGGLAVDGNGTLYVADRGNSRVRMISPDGQVSTLRRMAAGGAWEDATFDWWLRDVEVDTAGNVYILADYVIYKLTPAGGQTILAGWPGIPGGADGVGASARFLADEALALDASGNLYVADPFGRVRKVTPEGVVSTLAGAPEGGAGYVDGAGADARFRNPLDVAVDATGHVFVADAGNSAIRRISPQGQVSTYAVSPATLQGDPDGLWSALRHLTGLAVDSQGLLIVTRGAVLRLRP